MLGLNLPERTNLVALSLQKISFCM